VAVAKLYAPQAKVIRDPGRGKGLALRLGIQASGKPLVVQLDADGSMNPADIPHYVSLLTDEADIVKGSRNLPGGGSNDLTRLRVFGNHFFASVVNLLFGTRFTDLCYGFIAARRSVYDSFLLESDGFNVEAEILIKAHKLGFTIREIPSFEHRRIRGESHLHWVKDGFHILRTILSLFIRYRFSRSGQ
jgi:glycosyltransferase involved in cell wall biosynthesis